MTVQEFQRQINAIYGARDRKRGVDGTFRWLVEEVGELARAVRDGDRSRLEEEVGDVIAWTVSLASLCGVDVGRAITRYAAGCPKCSSVPCVCRTAV